MQRFPIVWVPYYQYPGTHQIEGILGQYVDNMDGLAREPMKQLSRARPDLPWPQHTLGDPSGRNIRSEVMAELAGHMQHEADED